MNYTLLKIVHIFFIIIKYIQTAIKQSPNWLTDLKGQLWMQECI